MPKKIPDLTRFTSEELDALELAIEARRATLSSAFAGVGAAKLSQNRAIWFEVKKAMGSATDQDIDISARNGPWARAVQAVAKARKMKTWAVRKAFQRANEAIEKEAAAWLDARAAVEEPTPPRKLRLVR